MVGVPVAQYVVFQVYCEPVMLVIFDVFLFVVSPGKLFLFTTYDFNILSGIFRFSFSTYFLKNSFSSLEEAEL